MYWEAHKPLLMCSWPSRHCFLSYAMRWATCFPNLLVLLCPSCSSVIQFMNAIQVRIDVSDVQEAVCLVNNNFSTGFLPFLFSLLVVQSLSINDKYILLYGSDDISNKYTVRKVFLQLAMCLLNFTARNVFWWSFSGLIAGLVVTLIAHHQSIRQEYMPTANINYDATMRKRNFDIDRRLPRWRVLLETFIKGALLGAATFVTLLLCNSYYKRADYVTPTEFASISDKPYLMTFVTMTAPRRGDPDYLSRTLQSYLINWPANPTESSLYSRIQLLIYTNFAQHGQFELAKDQYMQDIRWQKYLKWIQGNGTDLDQRLHVSQALELATSKADSAYISLTEDDFPICGLNEWKELLTVVYKANRQYPNHCGIFVGTGGRYVREEY
jgi:hypothetical protein